MAGSLSWHRYSGWEPEGGQRKAWADLQRGDLLQADRKLWSVVEVRPVPVIDWEDRDREAYERLMRISGNPDPAGEEGWALRPVYLIVIPAGGGKRHHSRITPYGSPRGVWVISPHHPVCNDCGELWPCREVEIVQEVGKQSAKLAELEKILPGCCWSCKEPVTHRQKAIRFDGDNLLLPGAPSPVFHVRGKGGCLHGALRYEKQWVAAEEGRRWRLQCPGKLIRHVDGDECSEDPYCPGGGVSHNTFMSHVYGRLPGGSVQSAYGADFRCLRCEDALVQRGLALGEPPPGALL